MQRGPTANYRGEVTVGAIAGVFATVFGVAFIWPQVIRVYVKQSVEGVAPLGPIIGLSGTLMWLTYGMATNSVPMMLSNFNIEVAFVALIVMLVRKGALAAWIPVVCFVVSAVFCLVMVRISPTIIGVAGVLIGTPAILPQLFRAIRSRHLYGVSTSSYVLLASMGSSWFVYGLSIGDPVVSYPNLILVPSASFIAWRASRSHHHESLATTA